MLLFYLSFHFFFTHYSLIIDSFHHFFLKIVIDLIFKNSNVFCILCITFVAYFLILEKEGILLKYSFIV
jgi:hypothetical protein